MRTQYPRPPVIQALIDFQVELPAGVELQRLTAIRVEEEFPTRSLMQTGAVSVGSEGVEVSATQELIGYRYVNVAKSAILQVRMNGFAYSRLADQSHPYGGWESVRDTARRLWALYREVAKPTAVTKITVRYVNRLAFPPNVFDLSEYLIARPEVPTHLPHDVVGWIMRVEMPQPDIAGAVLVMTQGRIDDETQVRGSAVLLDLDLGQVGQFPVDDAILWDALERLHERENDWFEGCITERTRELFR